MASLHSTVLDYLESKTFSHVTGKNKRTVQYQGIHDGRKVFGLYNEDGDWERETSDGYEALDYIGLKLGYER